MPLFNNRRGNAGTGKGFLTAIGDRRQAISQVRAAGEVTGNVTGIAPHLSATDREVAVAAAGSPQRKAFAAADAAGVSPKKQQRVFARGQKRGQSVKGLKKFKENVEQIKPVDPFD